MHLLDFGSYNPKATENELGSFCFLCRTQKER